MSRTVAESAAWSFVAAGLVGRVLHWFITPMTHVGASSWTTTRVGAQLALGLVAGAYGAYRLRVERRTEQEDAHLDRADHRPLRLPKDRY